jgi:hypothetical protein
MNTSLVWIVLVYTFNWTMLIRRWNRRRKQFDIRTRDVIFNLEEMGIATMARGGLDEDVVKRLGRRFVPRRSFCGVTPEHLNWVVNGVLAFLWFLSVGPILKRVVVLKWNHYRHG